MDDLAASAGAELYDYLYDYDWNVRMEALERLGKLGPAARAQHAGAVIDTWLLRCLMLSSRSTPTP